MPKGQFPLNILIAHKRACHQLRKHGNVHSQTQKGPLRLNFFAIDIRQIDLVMVRIGFLFAMKLNLGTLIGAITGIVITR